MRQYSLSFNSLIGSFIDVRTRRVAGAQWGCTQENRKKEPKQRKYKSQKSKAKKKKRKGKITKSPARLSSSLLT
jgi:hypothetical protein